MLPQALADALGSVAPSDGKAVYLSPTLHNPTTATMSLERASHRGDLPKAGAWIIEDGSMPPPSLIYPSCRHWRPISHCM
jgi:DNA-binding transcriptional MocR family regulator